MTEVFCIDTAWSGTVAHLIKMADAILLDLRGLSPNRRGTSREIEMLARQAAFGRVVTIHGFGIGVAWKLTNCQRPSRRTSTRVQRRCSFIFPCWSFPLAVERPVTTAASP